MALEVASVDAKASGNSALIPSKEAARKMSSQHLNRSRMAQDLETSLRRIQARLAEADPTAGAIRGQIHNIRISEESVSFSIYHSRGIRVLDAVSALPGGLMCDYTGGLVSDFHDRSGCTQKVLNFNLVAPSYSHDTPLALFENVSTDRSGHELLLAYRAFQLACLTELKREIFFARMVFDCAPHILAAFALACNGETDKEYRERRWAEARKHINNPANKSRKSINRCDLLVSIS
jgi:hypothetical protein